LEPSRFENTDFLAKAASLIDWRYLKILEDRPVCSGEALSVVEALLEQKPQDEDLKLAREYIAENNELSLFL
jgi:hypothetical protein